MPGIGFTVGPSAFVDQSPERAVDLFRRLLWAEAGRVGAGRNLIDVPDCINVGDGGVDAYIDNANPSNDDVIPQGSSVFQVKSADLQPRACRQELYVGGNLNGLLKPELEIRLKQGATYVLVLLADIPDALVRKRREAVQEELANLGYASTEVRVYTANQLASFVAPHPALVAMLRPELSTCLSYERWGTLADVSYPGSFVPDSNRQTLVATITEALRERSSCPIIRVTGLPGVGKTRTSYEALRPDDLRHQVLYAPTAVGLMRSPLLHALINDPEISAVLVVDECDVDQHRFLSNQLGFQGSRLALITMSYENARTPHPTRGLHTEPLGIDAIKTMLQQEYPDLPSSITRRLAEFADGYPRIAVLLADQYVKEGISDPYLRIPDDQLMDRLIGGTSRGFPEFRVTEAVLRGISLFQRVGVAGEGEDEGRWLAEYVDVPWRQFQDVVAEQKRRGVIQGEYYVFVTPFMLRVHLLERWWQAHGFTDQRGLDEFVSSMPDAARPDLLRRFFEHFSYVAAAPNGPEFAKKMLTDGGVISNYELLNTDLGGRFFLALTEVDPDSALRTAQRVLGNKSRDDLLGFQQGRRAMIDALKRMAVWKQLFQPAARLLLALGEAETESWSNNASGEFADLFSLGIREVASSEAPPSERLLVLEEALASTSPERRRLGLQACRRALSGDFSRTIGAEFQGIRREPELWNPSTYDEWYGSYRPIWELAAESSTHLEGEEKQLAVEVLLSTARNVIKAEWLVDMVINTIRGLASDQLVDRRVLINATTTILHYDGKRMGTEARRKLEELEQELSPNDFGSRMERYVAMELLEDRFDTEGNYVDQAQPRVEELAEEVIHAPLLLNTEMHWLVTERAAAGHRFGYELGKRDTDSAFLQPTLDALSAAGNKAGLSFVGGYLRALAERDPEEWESLLDVLSQDAVRAGWMVELTWRSGRLSEQSSQRLLRLIHEGTIAPETLRVFTYGALVRSLSLEDFASWVNELLKIDEAYGAAAALDLLVMYGGLPKELTLSILCHPSWFRSTSGNQIQAHDRFWWASTAESLCKLHPDVALELAGLLLQHFGETGTVADGFADEPRRILDFAMREQPVEVWRLVSPMLGPPVDSRSFHLVDWLRGSKPFEEGGSHILEEVPYELIWAWADEAPEARLPRLARFVPKVMCGPEEDPCLARELLLRYGDNPKVRTELRANFSSEGWVGSESQHFAAKRSWLLSLRSIETHPNVLTWLDEYLAEVERWIEHARQEEERQGW